MSLTERFRASVLGSWYCTEGSTGWTRCLKPLSWLYSVLASQRKARLLDSSRWQPPVPVIVVGNITVGGTGKTPVVAALVEHFRQSGYTPGVISRGFGAQVEDCPLVVTSETDPRAAGDEPVMLVRQLKVPLVVDPDRVQAARYLCQHFDCDLIIADDGLQHYNLHRHVELLVVDGQRLLGNGLCLPAGPLREPVERINSVDLVLVNGESRSLCPETFPGGAFPGGAFPGGTELVEMNAQYFALRPGWPQPLLSGSKELKPGKVHGVAGIGNPERFFRTLRSLGFDVIPHAFADHYAFRAEDIDFDDGLPVVMTSKDAVKCQAFADERHWYLPVSAEFAPGVVEKITERVERHSAPIQSGNSPPGKL